MFSRSHFGALAAALVLVGAGCSMHLTRMAKVDAANSMDCDMKEVMGFPVPKTPPWYEIRMTGCGEYRIYKASCDGTRNGCDNIGLGKQGCDGSCKISLIESGEVEDDAADTDGEAEGDGDDAAHQAE